MTQNVALWVHGFRVTEQLAQTGFYNNGLPLRCEFKDSSRFPAPKEMWVSGEGYSAWFGSYRYTTDKVQLCNDTHYVITKLLFIKYNIHFTLHIVKFTNFVLAN